MRCMAGNRSPSTAKEALDAQPAPLGAHRGTGVACEWRLAGPARHFYHSRTRGGGGGQAHGALSNRVLPLANAPRWHAGAARVHLARTTRRRGQPAPASVASVTIQVLVPAPSYGKCERPPACHHPTWLSRDITVTAENQQGTHWVVAPLEIYTCKRFQSYTTCRCMQPEHRLAPPPLLLAGGVPAGAGAGAAACSGFTCKHMQWQRHTHQVTCKAATGWRPLVWRTRRCCVSSGCCSSDGRHTACTVCPHARSRATTREPAAAGHTASASAQRSRVPDVGQQCKPVPHRHGTAPAMPAASTPLNGARRVTTTMQREREARAPAAALVASIWYHTVQAHGWPHANRACRRPVCPW